VAQVRLATKVPTVSQDNQVHLVPSGQLALQEIWALRDLAEPQEALAQRGPAVQQVAEEM